jgi:hypothetical protein
MRPDTAMSKVHDSLKTPAAPQPEPIPDDAPVSAPAAETETPAPVRPGLLRQAALRRAVDGRPDAASHPFGRPASASASDIQRKAQVLREGIERLEEERRALKARAESAERNLAEERKFNEELARQIEELRQLARPQSAPSAG